MNERKLRQLQALTALQSQMQAPQLAQDENTRRSRAEMNQMALGLLGLMQQKEEQQQRQQFDTGRLDMEQQSLDQRRDSDFLDIIAGNPNTQLSDLVAYREGGLPAYKNVVQERELAPKVGAMNQSIAGVYSTKENQRDPAKLQAALQAIQLQPGFDRAAWDKADWGTLNAMLPAPKAAGGVSGPTYPLSMANAGMGDVRAAENTTPSAPARPTPPPMSIEDYNIGNSGLFQLSPEVKNLLRYLIPQPWRTQQ